MAIPGQSVVPRVTNMMFISFNGLVAPWEKLTLPENKVDIWRIDLVGLGEIQRYRCLLSQDEIERADRFYFEKHRQQFSFTRAVMRQVLSSYINADPRDLVFSYGAKGKPALSNGTEKQTLQFSLSHSEDIALLAVAKGLTLGIDIEFINPEFATEEVAESFFSRGEVDCLMAMPPQERAHAFFSCWTRKESYIKAIGDGLAVPLDSFEVAFDPRLPAALLRVNADPDECSRWSMYDIEVAQEYKAALLVEGRGHELRRLEWQPGTLA
jgi:4'-phosphopantetheinyl transferase